MEMEITSLPVKADNPESYSDTKNQNKKENEHCELIYEVKTICNMDRLKSSCELLSNDTILNSENTLSDIVDKLLPKDPPTDSGISSHPFHCFSEAKSSGQESSLDKDLNSGPGDSDHGTEMSSPIDEIKDPSEPEHTIESASTADESEHMEESGLFSKDSEENLTEQQEVHSNESNESSEDIRRATRRNSKRKKDFDECCPICGVTVRLHDLETHYNQEVEKLTKIPKSLKKPRHEKVISNKTFEQIKNSRENRLTARLARYSARAKSEVKCPVCSLRMTGTAEEINKHVAFCVQDEDSDEMIVVDNEEEEDESFEEYEFGDQTRIRTISLVPGGYRSLQGQSTNRNPQDEDEVLNVDVDDTFRYGEPQYSELDVIRNSTCEENEIDSEQLRKAVVNPNVQPNILESRKWSTSSEVNEENSGQSKIATSEPIISSLMEKIKDLEDQSRNVKCVICSEPYTKPVVSTTCWHVHCEECWLMTMGVKKLCPQCNMIVFPSDLRKIFL